MVLIKENGRTPEKFELANGEELNIKQKGEKIKVTRSNEKLTEYNPLYQMFKKMGEAYNI